MFRLLALVMLCSAASLAAADQPNVIVILADDLGWKGLGCYGSTYYETPHLDRLAAEGMRFDNGYAAATVCAPSRASLMSGQYVGRHKITWVSQFQQDYIKKKRGPNLNGFRYLQPVHPSHLPDGCVTLGQAMREAGYATGMFGKWHLSKGRNPQYMPDQQGFDEYLTNEGMEHFGPTTLPDKVKHAEDVFLSDLFCDGALDFIDRQVAVKKPFFLYYADFLVHKPLEARQADLDYFAAKPGSETQKSPMAAAMHKALDDSVGRLMARLDERGIADNTLVIFTSDNGGLPYDEDSSGRGAKKTNSSNAPLRKSKSSEHEGGMRVPFIARWPARIPAGTLSHEVVHGIDVYPTVLAAAGGSRPADHVLDGADLGPVLADPSVSLAERDLFWYQPVYNHAAFGRASVIVRRGPWKLIHLLVDDEVELYNLDQDLSETSNVAAANLSLAAELKQAALDHVDATDAPRMIPNPDFDPSIEVGYK
ncbi:MAG: sulfatase [Planctomycetota bacterium]